MGLIFDKSAWPKAAAKAFDYIFGCHLAHALDFAVALIFYLFVWPHTFPLAGKLSADWIVPVLAFNFATEFIVYSFWHWMTHASGYAKGIKQFKYNAESPYEASGSSTGLWFSSTGQLQREIGLTTLGWAISAGYQILFMHLWASGKLPYIADFAGAHLWWNVASVLFVTYWREFHFYWVHRMIHPWWDRRNGLAQGDIGAFLYRWVHSVHHKSYNPGPWSGLAMHPVEHLVLYSCTLLPLVVTMHPMHFLYAKFHCDIAPIGGHDGHDNPGGGGGFHWLHHDKYECNYGVPLIDFDWLFGTWVDWEEAKKVGYTEAKKLAQGGAAMPEKTAKPASSGGRRKQA